MLFFTYLHIYEVHVEERVTMARRAEKYINASGNIAKILYYKCGGKQVTGGMESLISTTKCLKINVVWKFCGTH